MDTSISGNAPTTKLCVLITLLVLGPACTHPRPTALQAPDLAPARAAAEQPTPPVQAQEPASAPGRCFGLEPIWRNDLALDPDGREVFFLEHREDKGEGAVKHLVAFDLAAGASRHLLRHVITQDFVRPLPQYKVTHDAIYLLRPPLSEFTDADGVSLDGDMQQSGAPWRLERSSGEATMIQDAGDLSQLAFIDTPAPDLGPDVKEHEIVAALDGHSAIVSSSYGSELQRVWAGGEQIEVIDSYVDSPLVAGGWLVWKKRDALHAMHLESGVRHTLEAAAGEQLAMHAGRFEVLVSRIQDAHTTLERFTEHGPQRLAVVVGADVLDAQRLPDARLVVLAHIRDPKGRGLSEVDLCHLVPGSESLTVAPRRRAARFLQIEEQFEARIDALGLSPATVDMVGSTTVNITTAQAGPDDPSARVAQVDALHHMLFEAFGALDFSVAIYYEPTRRTVTRFWGGDYEGRYFSLDGADGYGVHMDGLPEHDDQDPDDQRHWIELITTLHTQTTIFERPRFTLDGLHWLSPNFYASSAWTQAPPAERLRQANLAWQLLATHFREHHPDETFESLSIVDGDLTHHVYEDGFRVRELNE
ncbi:MAG: hypothetical protein H0U74_03670 [Bradymonadaceae bacterium]|nr:hypothetical protein [Lujinxingiaceae bacterium]